MTFEALWIKLLLCSSGTGRGTEELSKEEGL